jgi:Protein of unknown function (DUF3108)
MSRFAHRKAGLILGIVSSLAAVCFAQEFSRPQTTPSGIRIGERLTYTISFQRYENVGYAETFAVSRGKLGDSEAIELRMKVKTTGLLSAIYPIDEARTTFASPDTGNPLFIRHCDNIGVAVREVVSNYLTAPTSGFDILTLLYKARQSAGSGSFVLTEGEKNYSVILQPQNGEHVKTDAGEFDTTISTVQSDYLLENGIQTLKINFSNDESHVPVLVRFKTAKGEIRIMLSGSQIVEPEVDATPSPQPTQTPKPIATPRPTATPAPYIDNQPLSSDLGFSLGEKLDYRVTNGSRVIGDISFQVKERKLVNREDSLLLYATVTSAEQGNGLFSAGDSIVAQVSPETLAPFSIEIRFSGPLAGLNQMTKFDQRAGTVTAGTTRIDSPVGTHCILSLLYAVRSFNLTPSKDAGNPVNDTRVAVYWEGKTYIFTLRPSESEIVTINGQKVLAQRVVVNTGVAQFDRLGLKLWLSTDENRVPLRVSLGTYQADLVAQSKVQLK